MSETISVREFIDTKLIPQAREMVDAGFAVYVFGVMAQGAKLVGAMVQGNIEDRDAEGDQFLARVKTIFAKRNKYTNGQIPLYALRNAMVHQMRPSETVDLTEIRNGAKSSGSLEKGCGGPNYTRDRVSD